MTAEAIARVVADLQSKRYRPTLLDTHPPGQAVANSAIDLGGPIIDATAIYTSLVAWDRPVHLYEDHPCIAPPWDSAYVCYQNEHGNVVVMVTVAHTLQEFLGNNYTTDQIDEHAHLTQPEPWKPADPVDWDRVKWVISGFVWCGGWTGKTTGVGKAVPTMGPLHLWQFAIYEDGNPADLHWVQLLDDQPLKTWDMANLVLLGALNFLNCSNVGLVVPQRPRAEARRVARTGVEVHTINVFPRGKSAKQQQSEGAVGAPIGDVRGHFAHYGPKYNRGLLFGKYEGKFWIPPRAVTDWENDYRLNP